MTPFVSSYACELHGSRNVKNHRSYNEETVKTLTRLSLFDHQNSLILPLGSSGSGVKVPFSKKFPLQLFRIESETSFDSLNFSFFEGGGIREVKWETLLGSSSWQILSCKLDFWWINSGVEFQLPVPTRREGGKWKIARIFEKREIVVKFTFDPWTRLGKKEREKLERRWMKGKRAASNGVTGSRFVNGHRV